MKWWSKQQLYVKILIGIIVGALIGFTIGDKANFILLPIGDIFLRLLKMLIVPVVFFTIVSGITKMEDIKSLGKIGGRLVLYYAYTSLIAVLIGLAFGLIFKPGVDVTGLVSAGQEVQASDFNLIQNIVSWIPTNPFEAFTTANVLQILFFSVILGACLLMLGEKVKTAVKVIDELSETMIKVTDVVMKFSPYGICALIATMVNTLNVQTLAEVGKFILTDYVAIIVVLIVVYPIQLKLSKINTLKFYKAISPAIIIAASTTSSAATLPVSLHVAESNLKLPEKIYGFGLTIGSTVNSNGMAVVIGIIGVFACNIYGIPLTFPTMFQIVFIGLMLSMGTAGVKGAGIVLSTVLLQTLGLPLDLVPILAAIWPLIDIAHTTGNVVGDLVGVSKIAANFGEMDTEAFNNSVIANK